VQAEKFSAEKWVPTELCALSGRLLPMTEMACSKLSTVLAEISVSGPKCV